VAALAAGGRTAAAATTAAAHPAAGRTFIAAAFEAEYGENPRNALGVAARAGYRVRRTKHQGFELTVTAITVVFVDGHQLLRCAILNQPSR